MSLLKWFPWRLKLVKYERRRREGMIRVGGVYYLYNPGVQDSKHTHLRGFCAKCSPHLPNVTIKNRKLPKCAYCGSTDVKITGSWRHEI